MPTAPLRPCPAPRCSQLTEGGPCPVHARQRDRARGSAQARGYDRAWAAYSKAWLVRFPWCGMRQDGQFFAEQSRCVQRGLRTRAQCVDHITPIRDGGAVFDPTNHQSLCFRCNRVKH